MRGWWVRPRSRGLSVLAGWWQLEVESLGDVWLPHADRYRRCSEFVDVLHAFWSRRAFAHRAEYYAASSETLTGPSLEPPPIFIAGESRSAIELAARAGDYLFINGGTVEQVAKLAESAKSLARERYGRTLKIALSAFGLARRTQTEAEQRLVELVKAPATRQIEYFAGQIDPAVVAHTRGSILEQIEANLGLNAGLVGDAEHILRRLAEFEAAGVDAVLVKSEPSVSEAEQFYELVIEPYRTASRVTRRAS